MTDTEQIFHAVQTLPVRVPARRAPWTLKRFAFLALSTSVVACNQIFGIAPGEREVPGQGGASASSTSTSTSTSTSGGSDGGANAPETLPVSLKDCVLLMHMDEPSLSSGSPVKDDSGHENNGTVTDSAATTADGKFGRAALFDGGGFISVLDSASLHPSDALTYSAWIYPTGLGNDDLYPGIISKRKAFGVSTAFTLFIWTSLAVWADIQVARFTSTTTLTNNQWYHLAIVFDGAQAETQRARIYINGALDSAHEAESSLVSNPEELIIGYLPQGDILDPSAFFVGRIDEVAIWTRALSADEIKGLAQAIGPL